MEVMNETHQLGDYGEEGGEEKGDEGEVCGGGGEGSGDEEVVAACYYDC